MQTGKCIETRFYKRKTRRTIIAWMFCFISLTYLIWRPTVFNFDAPLLSALFYAAELIGFILALGAVFSSCGHVYCPSKPPRKQCHVDVFIPVYKEPFDVIRRTLKAAIAIDYPHTTIVLDDGRRPEIKILAETLGCRYLSRDINTNAKAGNLNFGLQNTTGEFVMVFDADHIPQPHAIKALLGFFEDPGIAFVQTPQYFYNTDCLQFINAPDGALWHDQSYFYHIMQPNSARFNGTICIGTGVMYRRSAIEAIGGIPETTVTEDLHTSLKLQKQGFKSVYHKEPVAYGIGEATLSDFYKVRRRWAHGNIHALRHENILFCKGLTLRQRINYLLMGLIHLEGWQSLILYLIPVFVLFTGLTPFQITWGNTICIVLYPVITYLFIQELTCGYGRFWVNELYSMIRFPIAILATLALFRNRMSWRYAKKFYTEKVEWLMMSSQLAAMLLSFVAMGYAGFAYWGGMATPESGGPIKTNHTLDVLWIVGLWAFVNIAKGIIFMRKVYRDRHNSHTDYRFKIPIIAEIEFSETEKVVCTTRAISLSYLSFTKPLEIKNKNGPLKGRIYLPNFSLAITVEPENTKTPTHKNNNSQTEFSMHFAHKEDLQKLEDCLYSITWHRNLFHKEAGFMTPMAFLGRLFCFSLSPYKNKPPIWQPILLTAKDGHKKLAYKNAQKDAADCDMFVFEPETPYKFSDMK